MSVHLRACSGVQEQAKACLGNSGSNVIVLQGEVSDVGHSLSMTPTSPAADLSAAEGGDEFYAMAGRIIAPEVIDGHTPLSLLEYGWGSGVSAAHGTPSTEVARPRRIWIRSAGGRASRR
jgi:hypothetical protein